MWQMAIICMRQRPKKIVATLNCINVEKVKLYLLSWLLLLRRFLERCKFSSELLSSSEATAVLKSNWDWVCPKDGLLLGVLKTDEAASEAGRSFLEDADVERM